MLEISSYNPDIFIITETWFAEYLIINVPEYNVFYTNRSTSNSLKYRGGGVAIYIKEKNAVSTPKIAELVDNAIEQIWCVIKTKYDLVLVGCIYRPPDSSELANHKINNALTAEKKYIDKIIFSGLIIAGDFNYFNKNWKEGIQTLTSSNQHAQKFIDITNIIHYLPMGNIDTAHHVLHFKCLLNHQSNKFKSNYFKLLFIILNKLIGQKCSLTRI